MPLAISHVDVGYRVLHCVAAVYCCVLHCVAAVYCIVLQGIARVHAATQCNTLQQTATQSHVQRLLRSPHVYGSEGGEECLCTKGERE